MLKRETKTIGEYQYTVTQLDAMQGRRVFTRFARLVAPAFEQALQGVEGSLADLVKPEGEDEKAAKIASKLDLAKLAGALAKVVQNISEDDVDFFCEAFASKTEVKGEDGRSPKLSNVFALHFAGEYGAMLQWLWFCFEVNFGSFLGGIARRKDTSERKSA